MLKLKLQFFGGRGQNLGGGSGVSINIISETDVWTYRHNKNNERFVDEINTGVYNIQKDFTDIMDTVYTVSSAELGGKDKMGTLGYYGQGGLAINQNFTDVNKMNAVYDSAVKSGFHPSRGNKTGTEAVTLHEMGHALTDHLGIKYKLGDIDATAKTIVDNAYKASNGKGGTKKWAGGISGYAQQNNAECVAEAVADYYCNGSKASNQSKAIMKEIRRIARKK